MLKTKLDNMQHFLFELFTVRLMCCFYFADPDQSVFEITEKFELVRNNFLLQQ